MFIKNKQTNKNKKQKTKNKKKKKRYTASETSLSGHDEKQRDFSGEGLCS